MREIYYETDSLLHRLNPLTKIIASVPLILFLSLVTDIWTPATFCIFTLLVIFLLGRIPPLRFIRSTAPLLLLVLGYLLFYPFAVRAELVSGSPIVFMIGPLVVREAGILFAVATALRILSLVLLSLLFVLTTEANAFIRALIQQWHLSFRLGYGVMAAYRFIPMLESEIAIIRAAHRIRGISERGGLLAQINRLRRYTIPLLANAIRRAERVALAMDARAFGAYPTRTYYRKTNFAARDWLFLAFFWATSLALILVLQQAGLLGPLTFAQ